MINTQEVRKKAVSLAAILATAGSCALGSMAMPESGVNYNSTARATGKRHYLRVDACSREKTPQELINLANMYAIERAKKENMGELPLLPDRHDVLIGEKGGTCGFVEYNWKAK